MPLFVEAAAAAAAAAAFILGAFLAVPLPAATRPAKPIQILWRDPGRVEAKDLGAGPGGPSTLPKPPFRFLAEDLSGSAPKLKVLDANGHLWSVKFGDEVHSDPFAARLAWAVGYTAEPSHFVAAGRVLGVKNLTRAKNGIAPDGTFRNARFQFRSQRAKFSKQYNWSWVNNPFLGTRQLNGLKIMVMLTSDWDDKDARDIGRDANTAIFEEHAGAARRFLLFIPDWGGSMGKWGNVALRSKWDCKGYAAQNPEFVQGIRNGIVEWGYSGQRPEVTAGIRVEDVRWLLQYLGRITNQQLRSALTACGATPPQVACFTSAIRDRIERLQALASHPERWENRH